MRLSSLKLSGFKSFADRTTLQFKENRTAVVGPNGCGKSNVIDAIRWVMGESSARQLRGGSMQDVIFTGTAKRKPVGLASVELHFDNTAGKLGGAYHAYSELAVRRQVNRDGKSDYFLNGTKCRRRDITDIFLGTGLGPRSYAIIEQGMINRLVDAKPEELRVFIEEAAGISRYQARRRETLQHLEVTTQNLARLDDIAHELNAQLKNLKRQAETAVQYKTLEQHILTLKVEILSFQCEQSTRLQKEYTFSMNDLGEQFKLVRSELTTVEHDLTNSQTLFQRLIEQSTPLQQEWQQAEKQATELKRLLQQKQSSLQQNKSSLEQLALQKIQQKEGIQLLEIQLEQANVTVEDCANNTQQFEQNLQQNIQQFNHLKNQQQQVLQHFDGMKQQVEQHQQQHVKMQLQIEQLDKNLQRIEQQKSQLEMQKNQLVGQKQEDEWVQLQQHCRVLNIKIKEDEQQLHDLQQQCDDLQQQQATQQNVCRQLQIALQVLDVEQKNLQKMILPDQKKDQTVPALIQHLVLSSEGRQHAVLIEKFLAQWLQADILQDDQGYQKDRARQLKISNPSVAYARVAERPCLADWIESPQHSLWKNVNIVQDLTQALALQADLTATHSMLTLDGYFVGKDWLIGLLYDADHHVGQGGLSHQIRLEDIAQLLAVQKPEYEHATTQLQHLQQQHQQAKSEYQQQFTALQVNQKALQTFELQKIKLETALQAFEQQQQHLEQQQQQLDAQYEEDAMQKDELEIDLHAVAMKLEHILPDYKVLQCQCDEFAQQLEEQQQQIQQQQQEQVHQQRLLLQQQQQIELSEKDHGFLTTQYQQTLTHIAQTTTVLAPLEQELPEIEQTYMTQQEHTAQLEKMWQTWQVELNTVQQQQQFLTEQRQLMQQQDEQLRTQLEEKRLAWQALHRDFQHYSEQLKAFNVEAQLGLKLDLAQHQQQLAKVQQRFDKLGAVNLAAAAEYEDVLTRYTALEHQMQDLQHTVDQLKAAMKSIDQETKNLFMTTFDQVNMELQSLFPKVFQGGEACLTLEDDWQSGVKLMARPPGKRNSTLALLSGGEKALTALALVFAIFRLNPAPFCVLDEVDAPLDDANVARFCNLVKELSEQVQFIYITHNKLAMTMATDLLGVTMPEPGTSKLVTVNLEQAKEYGLVAES